MKKTIHQQLLQHKKNPIIYLIVLLICCSGCTSVWTVNIGDVTPLQKGSYLETCPHAIIHKTKLITSRRDVYCSATEKYILYPQSEEVSIVNKNTSKTRVIHVPKKTKVWVDSIFCKNSFFSGESCMVKAHLKIDKKEYEVFIAAYEFNILFATTMTHSMFFLLPELYKAVPPPCGSKEPWREIK